MENKVLHCGDFEGDYSDRIYIEKYLEGGISARSFYYSCNNPNNYHTPIGLGINNIDPKSIIGFCLGDAGTSHGIKRLKVSMTHEEISEILSKQSQANNQSEIATLRYEYDITKITERNSRRKSFT